MALMREWQPIDTAPKDGRSIIGYGINAFRIASEIRWIGFPHIQYLGAHYDEGWYGGTWNRNGPVGPLAITHWQPLPEPPLPHTKEDAKV